MLSQAINIGYSTRLLSSATFNAVIDGTDRHMLASQLSTIREFCKLRQFLKPGKNMSLDKRLLPFEGLFRRMLYAASRLRKAKRGKEVAGTENSLEKRTEDKDLNSPFTSS